MSAPKGNKYWQLRKKDGKGKKIETPELLWEAAIEYFEWCDGSPWERTDYKGKDVEEVKIPTQRPYTWEGLDNYLFFKFDLKRLDDYKANKEGRYKDYAEVITRMGKVIYQNKFEGAAVGAFNANIIARDLGLKDSKDVDVKSNGKELKQITGFEVK